MTGTKPMAKPSFDHFAIATEFIAWAITDGWSAYDVFAAIEEPAPRGARWNQAIWAVALKNQELEEELQHAGATRLAA